MKTILFFMAAACILAGCQKAEDLLSPAPSTDPSGFTRFIIPAGAHYCNAANFRSLETSALRFTVRFDSSAIYQTANPANQDDINKLWGLSDNGADHHSFSARFGWRWSAGALRLFGYVYNEGSVSSRELTSIAIGPEATCALLVEGSSYVFTVNGQSWTMPRSATTAKAKGYQLYPYFGGDEAAPHEVRIWIKPE